MERKLSDMQALAVFLFFVVVVPVSVAYVSKYGAPTLVAGTVITYALNHRGCCW
jgi:hypothetical protein